MTERAPSAVRLLPALVLLLLAPAAAAAGPPPALAVLAAEGVRSPDLAARQAGLVHLVQSELRARTAARVLSRNQTASSLDELGLAAAGLAEPQTAPRYGRAVTADYLVRIGLADDGQSASAHVQRVSEGREVWQATLPRPGGRPIALARQLADALAQALALPPAPVPPPGAAAPTLAVLDFRSEGEAGALDTHLGDLADLLSADLTAVGLPLVERGTLNALLQELGLSASGLARPVRLSRAAALAGAQRVLDTSLIVAGDEVLLDSQLVDPETGLVEGSSQVSGSVATVPALVQQLALHLAQAARAPVSDSGREELARHSTGSLEAALHAAAGWRLSREHRPEEAVAELQQAIFLDPTLASAWEELARQYDALRDYPKLADTARRFFAAAADKTDRRLAAVMAARLADAEMRQGRYAEEEAAARLALHYLPDDQDLLGGVIIALARQGRAAEVRAFAEDVYRRFGASSWKTFNAFAVGVQWLGFGEVPADATEPVIAAELDLIDRTLDAFDKGTPGPEYYLARPMTDALVLACGARPPEGPVPGLHAPLRHAEECLRLARRMASYADRPWTAGGGWLVTGLIEYKLGHGREAESALLHCLPLRSDTASLDIFRYTSEVYGTIYWLLGHTYQDLLKDPARAIASYRQAERFLLPAIQEAQDVRAQLARLQAPAVAPAAWRKTVGAAGAPLNKVGRAQLLAWLGAHGYELRHADDPRLAQRQEAGLHVLMWEGRRSDAADVDDLRAYVAGGGSLLVLLSDQRAHPTAGSLLGGSAESLDVTLDWLLPAFGLRLSHRALRPDAPARFLAGDASLPRPSLAPPPRPATPSPTAAVERAWESKEAPVESDLSSLGRASHFAPATSPLSAAAYADAYFPIDAPPGTSALRLQAPGQSASDTVVAVARVGLGKVALVSLRTWFASGDRGDLRLPTWQSELLQGVLDWLTAPSVGEPSDAAARWAESRAALAVRDFGGAVTALDHLPGDPEAIYWSAFTLDDKLGESRRAADRYRRVLASPQADTWLRRKANLGLGVLAVRTGDEEAARKYLAAAAGPDPDRIWGEAWVALGDLKLAQGDYPAAAGLFRKVADELDHSEPRCRALFGLAYALAQQHEPEAAGRVTAALRAEFGQALLPMDYSSRWPDPWTKYYPTETRKPQPTVAEVLDAQSALPVQ